MCDLESSNLIDLTSDEELTPAPAPTSISRSGKVKVNKKLLFPSEYSEHPSPRNVENNSNDDEFDNTVALPKDDPFEKVDQGIHFQSHQSDPTANVEQLISLSDDNILENDPQWNNTKNLENQNPAVFDDKEISLLGTESLLDYNNENPGCNKKLKKTQENRANLLKFSLTNAACNSPIVNTLSSLEGSDLTGTSNSSILLKKDWSLEPMLSSESPIKFIDDDFPSDDSQQFMNAEKKFEEDLKMMTIHIPEHLPTTDVDTVSLRPDEIIKTDISSEPISNKEAMFSLSHIKAQLKAKQINRENANDCMTKSTQSANGLIQSLESLIANKNGINDEKKKEATFLLEALKTTLSETETEKNEIVTQSTTPSLNRQSTFHVETEDSIITENQQTTVNEMPSCMINSAATFDGETNEEKDHLNLPEISPISPIETIPVKSGYEDTTQQIVHKTEMDEIHDLVDMLSKFLKTTSSVDTPSDVTQNSDGLQSSTNTFIVVMNSNDAVQKSNDSSVGAAALQLPNSCNDCDATDLSEPRRRSQSLSLHDKVKIIKLPSTPVVARTQMQHGNENTLDSLSPCNDNYNFDNKTPSKMLRRNSYSSTPYLKSSANSRPNTALPHFENREEDGKQESLKAKAMPLFSKPLPLFKMDTKKKTRPQTESIVRSSQPLKALQKMPPLIIGTPATPSKIVKRSSETRPRDKPLANAGGYLNACSTPALLNTKNKEPALAKSKFSLASATTSLSSIRRRSTSDFKPKSPFTARASKGANTTSLQSATKVTRLSLKTPMKLGNKLEATTSTAKLQQSNGTNPRTTLPKSTTLKNKENKRP